MFTPSQIISPSILPYLPFLSLCVRSDTTSASLIASDKKLDAILPYFFSSKSLVLDSGVSIPYNLILCFFNHVENPKSISTSTVSPSTTLKTSTLYSCIYQLPYYVVSLFTSVMNYLWIFYIYLIYVV